MQPSLLSLSVEYRLIFTRYQFKYVIYIPIPHTDLNACA